MGASSDATRRMRRSPPNQHHKLAGNSDRKPLPNDESPCLGDPLYLKALGAGKGLPGVGQKSVTPSVILKNRMGTDFCPTSRCLQDKHLGTQVGQKVGQKLYDHFCAFL